MIKGVIMTIRGLPGGRNGPDLSSFYSAFYLLHNDNVRFFFNNIKLCMAYPFSNLLSTCYIIIILGPLFDNIRMGMVYPFFC